MRTIAIAMMMALIAGSALIAGPALAQDHVQQYREEDKEKTQAQKDQDRQTERAYQRSLSNVPDQKPTDPWGIARGDDAAKKAASPAKPAMKQSSKTKGGGTTN